MRECPWKEKRGNRDGNNCDGCGEIHPKQLAAKWTMPLSEFSGHRFETLMNMITSIVLRDSPSSPGS